MGALLIGSRSQQFQVGLRLAESLYGTGDIPVIGSDKTFDFMGASRHLLYRSGAMMEKLSFETDPALDAQFPARRICRVKLETTDGKCYISDECEPRGEACENIGYDWLADKFRRITDPVLTADAQEMLIAQIAAQEDMPLRAIIDAVNKHQYRK